MPKCEDCADPNSKAVYILQAGSLGLVRSLCAGHHRLKTAELDVSLVPHQSTGIDAPWSPEEALANDLRDEETTNDKLRAHVTRLQGENRALASELDSRRLEESTRLRSDLEELQAENKRLNLLVANESRGSVVEGSSG